MYTPHVFTLESGTQILVSEYVQDTGERDPYGGIVVNRKFTVSTRIGEGYTWGPPVEEDKS